MFIHFHTIYPCAVSVLFCSNAYSSPFVWHLYKKKNHVQGPQILVHILKLDRVWVGCDRLPSCSSFSGRLSFPGSTFLLFLTISACGGLCGPFLFLLHAAQRIGVTRLAFAMASDTFLWPDTLLILQLTDALLLRRSHHFPSKDCFDTFKRTFRGLVQHHGVLYDVYNRHTRYFLKAFCQCIIL